MRWCSGEAVVCGFCHWLGNRYILVGLAWLGMAWHGLTWSGLARRGLAWLGLSAGLIGMFCVSLARLGVCVFDSVWVVFGPVVSGLDRSCPVLASVECFWTRRMGLMFNYLTR